MIDERAGDARPVRVLVADDHRLFREGVASLLERVPDITLVGEAGSGEDALRLTGELGPDVVLMDLSMPGMGGVDATRALTQKHPEAAVLVLTMLEDDESVFAALEAGARGYVLKDAERGDLVRAIRGVAKGEALLGSRVAQRVLGQVKRAQGPQARRSPDDLLALPAPFDRLTPREVELLRLMASGLRNHQIAQRLVISDKTVGNHISSIFAKLQVEDRVEAVLMAREVGLDAPDDPSDGSRR